MNNAVQVVITLPNNTSVDIQGDPQIVKIISELVGNVSLSYTPVGFVPVCSHDQLEE